MAGTRGGEERGPSDVFHGGDLQNVSDTALLVANMRAAESKRRKPLFVDPYAELFAADRGHRLAPIRRRLLPSGAVVTRTAVLDQGIVRAVADHDVDVVLNLGAGLDTRPYRLALPSDLHWVEVDLPDILRYKEGVLAQAAPTCRVTSKGVDLSDRSARRSLLEHTIGTRRTLVVTEGVLPYLAPEAVAELAQDLADQAGVALWWVHFVAPVAVRWGNRLGGRKLAAADATFKFAPDGGVDFFRALGWSVLDERSLRLEQRRLGREAWPMRVAWELSPQRLKNALEQLETLALLQR